MEEVTGAIRKLNKRKVACLKTRHNRRTQEDEEMPEENQEEDDDESEEEEEEGEEREINSKKTGGISIVFGDLSREIQSFFKPK